MGLRTLNSIIFIVFSCSFISLNGQSENHWKGKRAAIAFTYDDALNEHLDIVVPTLDSFNIKGTFYVAPIFESLNSRMEEWRQISSKGHELGNHTLFHPCDGGTGREWVSGEQDLRKYSYHRILNEIKVANNFLTAIDGKIERTFAFTCGDRFVEGKEFIGGLSKEIKGARSVRNEMHTIDQIDVYNVDGYVIKNHSFEEMKSWVDRAIDERSLLVFVFHGVDGGHHINCTKENHSKIIQYVASKSNNLLVEPFIEIVNYIKEWQKKNSKLLLEK